MQSDDDYVGEIKTTGQLLSIVKLKTTGSSPFISSGAQYTAQTFPCEHFDAMVAHFDASLGAKAIGEILPRTKLPFAPFLRLSLAHLAPFDFSRMAGFLVQRQTKCAVGKIQFSVFSFQGAVFRVQGAGCRVQGAES